MLAVRSTNEVYHGRLGFVHASGLRDFIASPLAWYETYVTGTRPKAPPTPEMAVGTLTHAMSLEPEIVEREFVCVPASMARNMSRAVFEAWSRQHGGGRMVFLPDQWRLASEMAAALRESQATRDWLTAPGEVELSLDWEEFGLQWTARLDKILLREPRNAVVDVKTSAWLGKFNESIPRYGYDLQAATYESAVEHWTGRPTDVFFAVVEKRPERRVGMRPFREGEMVAARAKRRWIAEQIKKCWESGVWPDNPMDYQANTVMDSESLPF